MLLVKIWFVVGFEVVGFSVVLEVFGMVVVVCTIVLISSFSEQVIEIVPSSVIHSSVIPPI